MYLMKEHELQLISLMKDARAEGQILLPMPKSAATALRAQAYAMAKKLRKLSEDHQADMSIQTASQLADSITMTLVDNGLIFRRKDHTPGMLAVKAYLDRKGIKVEDPVATAADASLERLRSMAASQGLEVGDEAPMVLASPAEPEPQHLPVIPTTPLNKDEPPPAPKEKIPLIVKNPYYTRDR